MTELYNSNGAIANAYTYAPFGGVSQTGTITNPLQWSSEVYDAELGMVYYNFRFYNPREGRWISRDPIGEKGGANLYGFVGNCFSWKFDCLGAITQILPPLTSPTTPAGQAIIYQLYMDGTLSAAEASALTGMSIARLIDAVRSREDTDEEEYEETEEDAEKRRRDDCKEECHDDYLIEAKCCASIKNAEKSRICHEKAFEKKWQIA